MKKKTVARRLNKTKKGKGKKSEQKEMELSRQADEDEMLNAMLNVICDEN